jgi:hypothetical protein
VYVLQPNYILLSNTEAAGVITAATNTIRDYLCCNDPNCDHGTCVKLGASGGYFLFRPDCTAKDRPGLWTKESIDACKAYLSSIYERSLLSDDPDWQELRAIICRFHDIKCHKVRKTPSWPRSWANFSPLSLYSHGNTWANLHIVGQPNTFLASGVAC